MNYWPVWPWSLTVRFTPTIYATTTKWTQPRLSWASTTTGDKP